MNQIQVLHLGKRKWKKEDERLKKKKIEKQYRPKQPEDALKYPSKSQIALDLMEEFVEQFPDIRIKGVVGDTVYGSLEFMEKAAALTKQMQVVSKIKKNQFVIVSMSSKKVPTAPTKKVPLFQ